MSVVPSSFSILGAFAFASAALRSFSGGLALLGSLMKATSAALISSGWVQPML